MFAGGDKSSGWKSEDPSYVAADRCFRGGQVLCGSWPIKPDRNWAFEICKRKKVKVTH